MMKKFLIILLSLLTLGSISFAESFTSARVKSILESQFSKALSKKVEIEELSGNLYNKVELTNVKVYESNITKEILFFAEKIEIRYSLKDIILSQDNFLDSISRLTIHKPWIRVNRNKQGEFNIFNLSNDDRSNGQANTQAPLTEKAKILVILNDGKGYYADDRGWAEKPIGSTFIKELNSINGQALIEKNHIKFEVAAELPVKDKYSLLKLKGTKALNNNLFDMNLTIADINLEEWANYTAPMPDIFIATKGIADLEIVLKQGRTAEDLLYNIMLDLKAAALDLPVILKKRLNNINGHFSVSNDLLTFRNLRGNINNHLPVVLNGSLKDFSQPRTNIKINAKNVPAHILDKYVSGVPGLPVKGSFDVDLEILGSVRAPRVRGSFYSSSSVLLGMDLNNSKGWLDFHRDNLYLELSKVSIFGGNGTISGNIRLENQPDFDLNGTIENAAAQQMFNFDEFQGFFSGKIKIDGPLNNMSFQTITSTANLTIYDQAVTNVTANVYKISNNFIFKNCLILLNNNRTTLNGVISDLQHFEFSVTNNYFSYRNQKISDMPVLLKGLISARLKGDFQEIDLISSAGSMSLKESLLLGESNVSGDIEFSSRGSEFKILSTNLNKNKNHLVATGSLAPEGFSFSIKDTSVIDLSSLNFFKRLLPGIIIDARADLKGEMSAISKNYVIDLDFEIKNKLVHDQIEIDKARGRFLYKDNSITFKDLLIQDADERYQLEVSFPAKKKLSFEDNIFLDVKLKNAQIKNLFQFYSTISKTIRLSNISQEPLQKTNYKLSFDNSPLLYLKNSTKGLLNKYQLYRSTIETIDLFNEALLPDGAIDGDFFFNWSPEKLFLNSNLELRSFAYGAITAKKMLIDFETKENRVLFNTNILDLSNQYNSFSETKIVGQYLDGSLVVDQFDIAIDNNNYRNILRGSYPLSGYWDESASNNSLELMINMPNNSISILSLITGTKSISHSGSLSLNIGGTYQNPIISSGSLKVDDLSIGLAGLNEVLLFNKGNIDISNNNISVTELNSRYYDPNNKNTSISLKTGGNISLKNLSLADLHNNIIGIDIKAQNTRGKVNINNLYSGNVNLSDISLSGDYQASSSNIYLRGDILLEDGTIFLPDITDQETANNLNLDLKVKFAQNVAIRQGRNLIEGDLSKIIGEINIFIDPRNSGFTIAGPLSDLRFSGLINFDEGFIKFLNRDFYFINKEEQQPYLKNYPERIRSNQLVMDSSRDNDFTFHLRSETVIFEEVITTEDIGTTGNVPAETKEQRFVFIVDGPLNNIGSFTFLRYEIENNSLTEVGEPYYLKDPQSQELLADARFQELVYDLAPSFLKNPSQDTGRQLARDIFYSEINQYFKTLIRPYEKLIAKQTGLYDVRVKGDFAQETAKMLKIEETAEYDAYYNKLALELVYELYQEKIFFTLDTTLDQLNSYKITWYILTQSYIDELSANFGSKYDYYRRDYTPMFSLEVNDAF